jgi:non-reducing end alpha-L-arabinofuranosidase
MRTNLALMRALAIVLTGTALAMAQQSGKTANVAPSRPEGPCDIYAAAGTPCAAAHSTTRALYASYNGPLYQVLRQSDGKTLDIGVVKPVASPVPDAGGYADAAAQDAFCPHTYCWITTIYDQSPKHNDLTQAPRGGFSGPALGGLNNIPLADSAPLTVMGHKVYGVFIEPGMGLRQNDPKGTAVDDQAEGQYWVINGQHFNSGCCFDYGNAEIDSRDDDNGTMETTYFGDAPWWFHGKAPGPWIMTDQENNLVGCVNPDGSKLCVNLPNITWRFVTAMAKGEPHHWTTLGGDATQGPLSVMFDGPRVDSTYDPMRKQGAILLGNGGDNSNGSQGTFYEGAMTAAGTFPTDATDQQVQTNVVAARYGVLQPETAVKKAQNESPIKINEFRISSGPPANSTDSFIELYNTGRSVVDISNWTLTAHPTQQAIFSAVKIPAGTKVAAGGFYLLGLSNSGLAVNAHAGDTIIHVRSTTGMSVGDTVSIDSGSDAETHKIVNLGTAATNHTTVWQPLPDGPIFTIPVGSTNVPVASVSGFAVGQKIALGYGAKYPSVARELEQYEVVTVTAIGKPGTQAYLAADVPVGASNIQVTSVEDISVGDKIRLDIDSVGHGIETVVVGKVGTKANRTNLTASVSPGATRIGVRRGDGFTVGNKITVGTPASREVVTVTAVSSESPRGASIEFTPALAKTHGRDEWVVSPGTGLELAAPLKFMHAANLPFSNRGTGISFQPATDFAHSSNEPVLPLGTGIALDGPLTKNHAVNAVVHDVAVTTAGYQGTPAPNQWFGGPELTTNSPLFGRIITIRQGSMVLRNASGVVVDSLNYGGIVDPWAAQGNQSVSGIEQNGCFAPAGGGGEWFNPSAGATNTSTGRFPNGQDTGSNCADFLTQAAANLSAAAAAGATNIKVSTVAGFAEGQKIAIGTGTDAENSTIAAVGSAGATTLRVATIVGATEIPVAGGDGFRDGQTVMIDDGVNSEEAVIASVRRFGGVEIAVTKPLARAHAAGAQLSGSGITLTTGLTRAHAREVQVTGNVPTPGAPNQYYRKAE